MNITQLIIYAVTALLVVYAVYYTIQKFRGKAKNSCCGGPELVAAPKVDDTDESHYPYHYTLSIDGMMCSNCARNVEKNLDAMDGVWARVNLGKNQADVLAKQPQAAEDFREALKKTDYIVTGCTPA